MIALRVALAGWLLAPLAALAVAADPAAALRAPLHALAAGERVRIAGEEIVSHVALPRLYDPAAGALLWQAPARRAELLAAVRGALDDGLRPSDYHLAALEQLAADGGHDADFDLLASDAYLRLLYDLYLGRVDPLAIEPNWNLKPRPLREEPALAYVRDAIASGQIREAVARARPQHWLYERGRAALARYRQIAAAGGWPSLPAGPKLAPGGSDPRVPALRRRLAASDDYAGPAEGPPLLDAALAAALGRFQRRHGLTADGTLGPATLRELNVPVAARIDQIRLNLERGRWVLNQLGEGDLLVVDIAGFGVRLLHDRQVVWRARAIVGQPYRQTPVFRAEIEDVVFNPTWTVPPGILAKDVLPGLQRGEDVLAHKHLRLYDRAGAPVDPARVHWPDYSARHFPFVLRQDAGDDNALGHVKIDFPNPYLVYLHDTPSRSLFDRNDRTFSSGCIRVERPLELAERLLADPAHWDAAAIRAAVEAGTTRTVRLARPVPVLLIYWTAEVDPADGRVIFKRDVYRRDARLLRALDGEFRFGTRVRA
ncbi:MAG: L,D-transpeptidase family protein [Proteobacteria bacterium]|nr:L,D-transpeptidase family protein [Pseudomonadota bacterium]